MLFSGAVCFGLRIAGWGWSRGCCSADWCRIYGFRVDDYVRFDCEFVLCCWVVAGVDIVVSALLPGRIACFVFLRVVACSADELVFCWWGFLLRV